MTTTSHQPVMDLIHASLDPASRTAESRAESPACQVVIAAARADAKDGDMQRVQLLAIGAAVAASLFTEVLANRRDMSQTEMLEKVEAATRQSPQPQTTSAVTLPQVLRTLSAPGELDDFAQLMARLFAEDQERFLDLIVELGDYIAVCVDMYAAVGLGSRDDAVEDVDKALQDFAAA